MRLSDADLDLVRAIVARRAPDLLPELDTLGTPATAMRVRELLRAVLVDEACDVRDTGPDAARRVLALEQLLARV